MPATDQIIGFYSGENSDHRGRNLHDIQRWSVDQLEGVHDYIQWLFPLPERSGFNMAAPVLSRETIETFRARPDLQEKLRVSFVCMMHFYGLEVHAIPPITVMRSPEFAVNAVRWLSPGNHNHLRITRILESLSVLGLEPEAGAFFKCLAEIYAEEQSRPLPAISYETFQYWSRAANVS